MDLDHERQVPEAEIVTKRMTGSTVLASCKLHCSAEKSKGKQSQASCGWAAIQASDAFSALRTKAIISPDRGQDELRDLQKSIGQ